MSDVVRTYVKRPVQVQAIRWSGAVSSALRAFLGGVPWLVDRTHLLIPTLEGEMRSSPGDYIIRGVTGEVYPCRGDIFKATYEAVLESDPGTAQ